MPTLGLISAPNHASDAPSHRAASATRSSELLDEKYLASLMRSQDIDSHDAGKYMDQEAEDEIEDETVFDAVNLAAKLWSNEHQQTHQFREAVFGLLSLGLSWADIAYTLRQSVHAKPMRN
jgi:hypothetical protein